MKEMGLEFNDINQAQLYFYGVLLNSGSSIETRGLDTLEITPAYFKVNNPRARITSLKGRNWKLAPALGELSWHLSGSKDLDFIANYLANWKYFSEDNSHITGSCYGFKIFENTPNKQSKWKNIISLLKNDIHSRRAVITLLDPAEEISLERLDISCTISIQFLIRNGQLDILVNMRSNDLVWGLPYDFFLFSYLQELMALELGIPVGIYHHFAASLHIYKKHINLAKKIVDLNIDTQSVIMPPITSLNIKEFTRLEEKLRKGTLDRQSLESTDIDHYWKELLKIIYSHYADKSHERTIEKSSINQTIHGQ